MRPRPEFDLQGILKQLRDERACVEAAIMALEKYAPINSGLAAEPGQTGRGKARAAKEPAAQGESSRRVAE
jgi:hypothetical protein